MIQRAPTPAPYSSPTKSEPKHEVTVSEPRSSSNSSQSNESSSPSPVPPERRTLSPQTSLEPEPTAPVLEVEIETSSPALVDALETSNLEEEPIPEPETVIVFENEEDEELLEHAPVLEPERATITPVSHSGASQNGSILTEDGTYQVQHLATL